MPLEQKVILQINATIIAGALIFLTVVVISTSNTSQFLDKINALTIGLTTVMIFGLSSIFAIGERKIAATQVMKIGFVMLVLLSANLFIYNIYKTIQQGIQTAMVSILLLSKVNCTCDGNFFHAIV
ncbi:MAG TPA: hypothetical protein VF884_05225 [Nitrososphaeraceae archaeon]